MRHGTLSQKDEFFFVRIKHFLFKASKTTPKVIFADYNFLQFSHPIDFPRMFSQFNSHGLLNDESNRNCLTRNKVLELRT